MLSGDSGRVHHAGPTRAPNGGKASQGCSATDGGGHGQGAWITMLSSRPVRPSSWHLVLDLLTTTAVVPRNPRYPQLSCLQRLSLIVLAIRTHAGPASSTPAPSHGVHSRRHGMGWDARDVPRVSPHVYYSIELPTPGTLLLLASSTRYRSSCILRELELSSSHFPGFAWLAEWLSLVCQESCLSVRPSVCLSVDVPQ